MNNDTNKFDCRTINNGTSCEHLSPWNLNNKDEFARICTCKALNVVIFPEYRNLGKINQKLIGVKPLFHCPKLQDMRINGTAPQIVATIDKNSFKNWFDD